jgi:predicted Zn-dependent peptidase
MTLALAPQARSNAAMPEIVALPFAQGSLHALRAATPAAFALTGSFRTAPVIERGEHLLQQLVVALLTCGTRRRDEFAFAEALESRGASLAFAAEPERVSFSVNACTADLPVVVDLLGDALHAPRFDDASFHAERQRMIAGLQAIAADPATLVDDALARALYAPSHPRHQTDVDTAIAWLEAFTVDDVRRHHRDHFGANTLRIVAVGDVEPDAVATALDRSLADWAPRPVRDWPASADVAPPPSSAPIRIDVPDSGHFQAAFGQRIALRCDHPDYAALWLANHVLGAGFGSRLVASVREAKGLTYAIRSQLSKPDPGFDGHWQIDLSLSPEALDAGLAATRETLARFVDGGVGEDELDLRRRQAIGAFQISLATVYGLSETVLMGLEQGWGADHLRSFPERLRAVDAAQLDRVLRTCFVPDAAQIAIAGPFDGDADA